MLRVFHGPCNLQQQRLFYKIQTTAISSPIDVNGATSSESTVSYYDNDVQSTTFLSFEHEQIFIIATFERIYYIEINL